MRIKLGVVASHPIQYQAPWFRNLAERVDLTVIFACQLDAKAQGKDFGRAFVWDVDLLSGYRHEFLTNISQSPDTARFFGCDTPAVGDRINKENFDAVILTGWNLKSYWQASEVCRKRGIPVLVRGDSQLETPRSKVRQLIKKVVYPILLKRFDGFLCVGTRNREYLKYYGVGDERIFSAPHFIDNDWFSARAVEGDRVQIRSQWGCREDEVVVLFAGKFIEEKRAVDLLRAVASLPESIHPLVVMVGGGELESCLRTAASEAGIRVVFTGFKNQSELPELYAAADAIVLPSYSETWGLVVNEAMACGIPAVVSDACGCAPDLVEDGVTGFTYPCGDVVALAVCLKEIVRLTRAGHDWRPSLREKLERYSVQTCSDGTIEALYKLTEYRREVSRKP
jgi:glycosyltransferase involved in cell wall biosynthesis